MVVFQNGKPKKSHYRRFRIKTVQGIDDFRMMAEVISRRYSGSLARSLPFPDLILVDGGKGQLSAACAVLSDLTLRVPVVGLAKRFERLFLPGQEEPIVLLASSPVLHLLQHLRDEAHRFAIAYHRLLRSRALTHPTRRRG
jgi:excinuclease ABC subunit C